MWSFKSSFVKNGFVLRIKELFLYFNKVIFRFLFLLKFIDYNYYLRSSITNYWICIQLQARCAHGHTGPHTPPPGYSFMSHIYSRGLDFFIQELSSFLRSLREYRGLLLLLLITIVCCVCKCVFNKYVNM